MATLTGRNMLELVRYIYLNPLRTGMVSNLEDLARLFEDVSAALQLDSDAVKRPSKSRAPAAARGIICYLAIFELGYTGSEVGKFQHLGPTGVSLASRRGKKMFKADPMKMKEIVEAIEK